jgi:hypothetical protein
LSLADTLPPQWPPQIKPGQEPCCCHSAMATRAAAGQFCVGRCRPGRCRSSRRGTAGCCLCGWLLPASWSLFAFMTVWVFGLPAITSSIGRPRPAGCRRRQLHPRRSVQNPGIAPGPSRRPITQREGHHLGMRARAGRTRGRQLSTSQSRGHARLPRFHGCGVIACCVGRPGGPSRSRGRLPAAAWALRVGRPAADRHIFGMTPVPRRAA